MLVSPKWQTMWMESQHCSKSVMNVHLPAQRAKRVLEDLRTNCSSPNKLVQLEALQCWRLWIKNQNADDWKLNTVCFTAVKPLIIKKMQPLHKDVDICKMKLSLLWALVVKVESIMQLEGPQYILEVFLQSCLSWLSSASEDGCENEISLLIFKLLLSIFNKNGFLSVCDKEMFTPLTVDVLNLKKIFHHLADTFLSVFIYWRKVPDKSVFLQLWKHFLEHCELSCEHIPIPLWHKVFKLTDQICSEKSEPVKERLAFLHSCATALKSALSSSKFIDFGNLLTTPCEALFKKLVELCTVECIEHCDFEMFLHSKEICQILSEKSVSLGGFDLCIGVLDVLEEFSIKDLLWGVWCGLVYCYKLHLLDLDKNYFTRIQMKYYRKLRGVAVNFELDRDALHEDCISEVERHIDILNINCFCSVLYKDSSEKGNEIVPIEPMGSVTKTSQPLSMAAGVSERIFYLTPTRCRGTYSTVALYNRIKSVPKMSEDFNIDLIRNIKNILKSIDGNSTKSLLNCLFGFRLIRTIQPVKPERLSLSLQFEVDVDSKKELSSAFSCLKAKTPSPVPERVLIKRNALVMCEWHQKAEAEKEEEQEEDVVVSIPRTRSRKRAEEEMKKQIENQKRKKRKSFEVLVQEIVRKNKERKTEKNSKRKIPALPKSKKSKNKVEKPGKENQDVNKVGVKKAEISERKLRQSKKEELKNEKKKTKNSFKVDGKLENYFKIIRKKSGVEVINEKKKSQKGKKKKESRCCIAEKEEGGRKDEIGWRQTSLKTMMNRKKKVEKNKVDMRTRNKNADVADEKTKPKRGKKVMGSPLSKLSSFKKVFHDHEYAKLEPQEPQTFERALRARQEKLLEVQTAKKTVKPNTEVGVRSEDQIKKRMLVKFEKSDLGLAVKEKTEIENFEKPEYFQGNQEIKVGGVGTSELLQFAENIAECKYSEKELEKMKILEESNQEERDTETEITLSESELKPFQGKDRNELLNGDNWTKSGEQIAEFPVEKIPEVHAPTNDVTALEGKSEISEFDSFPNKRGKKRVRMLDSVKPSKKIKLDEEDPEEEKLPLEITEKENLEEKQPKLISSTKKEIVAKVDASPKSANGMISSRALRMIALVPESTKSSQMQWESRESRVEVLKCKKAPNVDKNSRASKMLALLSENITELQEVDVKTEEINRKGLATSPNVKTPASSLRSPKSLKKRRSIRFDDAKNETVLYQTDTPPSQILEEKEKWRRIKPVEY